jgi:hypothetical protein
MPGAGILSSFYSCSIHKKLILWKNLSHLLESNTTTLWVSIIISKYTPNRKKLMNKIPWFLHTFCKISTNSLWLVGLNIKLANHTRNIENMGKFNIWHWNSKFNHWLTSRHSDSYYSNLTIAMNFKTPFAVQPLIYPIVIKVFHHEIWYKVCVLCSWTFGNSA